MPIRIVCAIHLLIAAFLCACAPSDDHTPNIALKNLESPLQSPLLIAADNVPTPDLTRGSVRGQIFVRVEGAELPVRGENLFLAPIGKTEEGVEVAAILDRLSNPRATTDNGGNFSFYNVPPGRYGLVFDQVPQSFLLNRPPKGDSLVIEVTAGEVTDVGRLVYDEFPVIPTP